ncbi:MAG: hypothetical protein ACYDAI_03715 [Trichloromonadaceae bacterium]
MKSIVNSIFSGLVGFGADLWLRFQLDDDLQLPGYQLLRVPFSGDSHRCCGPLVSAARQQNV